MDKILLKEYKNEGLADWAQEISKQLYRLSNTIASERGSSRDAYAVFFRDLSIQVAEKSDKMRNGSHPDDLSGLDY